MLNSRQTFIFNHFKNLISSYDGSTPFHNFFKKYCKLNTALGSNDRKLLREILYSVFRLGPQWKTKSLDEVFLWPAIKNPGDERLEKFYAGMDIPPLKIDFQYPFESFLSDAFKSNDYYESLTNQPLVWVRVNKLNASRFKSKYQESILMEESVNAVCVAYGLANSTAIEDEPYTLEIQDLSSQIVSSKITLKDGMKVWDCCCGAGGKSLFIAENYKKIKHFASDVRPSIIRNLKERFSKNKLPLPKTAVIDLSEPQGDLNFQGERVEYGYFNAIIADVPCSGSGTWAREPENLSFFDEDKLKEMTQRQKQIVNNSLPFLEKGGKLYYITCSVFEAENLALVEELANDDTWTLVNHEMISGYEKGADSLFIAELSKN